MRSRHTFFTFSVCFPVCTVRFSVGRPRPSMRHRNSRKPGHEQLSAAEPKPLPDEASSPAQDDRARRVRDILSRKQLSLLQVSVASAQIFGAGTPYHVPHNLYYDLRNCQFTPNLHQFIALSSISGYSLYDWFSIFGIYLDNIVRMQMQLSFPRTVLLDTNEYDFHAVMPRLEHKGRALNSITPFHQVISQTSPQPVGMLLRSNKQRFLYAKLGSEDTLPFPELLPGSVVRVEPQGDQTRLPGVAGGVSRHLYLLEHSGGLSCSRVRQIAPGRLVLVPSDRNGSDVELRLGSEVRVLGAIDMEVRRFQNLAFFPRSRVRTKWRPEGLPPPGHAASDLGHLISSRRQRNGLSFRQASTMSNLIAAELGDEQYSAAFGSLSDYEAVDTPPRHVQKVLSLCILYSISFWDFLQTAKLAIDKLGTEPMPEELAAHSSSASISGERSIVGQSPNESGMQNDLVDRFAEIPYFLRHVLPELTGMSRISMRDVFWIENGGPDFQWPLRGAVLLVVNRRIKRLALTESQPGERRNMYLFMRRDGSFACGHIGRDRQITLLHDTTGAVPSTTMRLGPDADMVGQVVACLRHIEPVG